MHAAPALPVKKRVNFHSQVSPDISLYPVNDVGERRIRISSEKREEAKRATLDADGQRPSWSDSHSRPIQFIANTRNQRCKEEEEEEED